MIPVCPEHVNIYVKGEREFPTITGARVRVKPAFAVDSKNPKTNETARAWAQENRRGMGGPGPSEHISRNGGFRLKIVDLESREGGRVYKVMDQHGHFFDLREETVTDVIANVGIQAGGDIPCTFTWVRRSSQLRLVREGSQEHLAALEADSK
jgi:hypothetical protein